ncbi:transposase [Deinobacterium chartae]|uniref:Transposase n=1 Tax=Deinobacterium chartae TaxID=521158 RepID=A0A841HYX2_9DEIO|nr:helix-turn-helix domain-containing protein [Deinobacterium chartae]MBB6097158.1 transposase [Deinobacterium chartae]
MSRPLLQLQPHLTHEELTQRYRSCRDPKERSRWHAIWLLSGPDAPAPKVVARLTGYSVVWIRQLIHRYNEHGPEGLQDLHRKRPGGKRPILNAEQQAELAEALRSPAPDGGPWTGAKVAEWCFLRTGHRAHPVTGWSYIKRLTDSKRGSRRSRRGRIAVKRAPAGLMR